jgi:hypothetical protein
MFAPSSAPVTEPYLNEMEFEKLRLSQKETKGEITRTKDGCS